MTRSRALGAASVGAAALGAALILGFSSCARKPPEPVYPYAADTARPFFATSSGLSEMIYQGEAEAELPASIAPNASVLSADAMRIAVAVNGWGVELIEASPDGKAYRLIDNPLPAFAGLSTGGAWPLDGGFLVQLYRDPFLGADSAATGAGAPVGAVGAARLVRLPGGGGAATLPDPFPRDIAADFELFALLPARGTWFAELRKDSAERVDLKFFAFGDALMAPREAPPSGARPGPSATPPSIRAIGRAEFEAALRPLSLSGRGDIGPGERIGPPLRSALAALGPGPWLVRLRSQAGEDRWYLSAGKAEEATKAFAWSFAGAPAEEDARVLAMTAEGKLALSGGRGLPFTTILAPPAEGASFTALAAAGSIAAAAWESGEFPNISQAGILLTPLP